MSKQLPYGNISSEYLSGEHGFHGEKFRRIAGRVTGEKRKRELIEYSMQFLKVGEFGRSSAEREGRTECV